MNPLSHYHLPLGRLLGPLGSAPAAVAGFIAPPSRTTRTTGSA
jgi:hypothetical protein